MDEFSPTEAALEGLRITRERPVAVLWWWGGYFIATFAQLALGLSPPMKRVAELQPQVGEAWSALLRNPADNAASLQLSTLSAQVEGWAFLFIAVVLLFQMILSTAILRAVLRPADSAFGYLRLSMDELRQLGLAVLAGVVFLAYAFVVSLATTVLVSILKLVFPQVLAGAVVFAIVIIAFLYPAVRLSLAPAMTLADGRISFRRSWALTRGRFWPLFGSYIIAFVLSAALWATAIIVLVIISAFVLHGATPMPQRAIDLLSPATLVVIVINSLFAALMGTTVTAPLASAFRQITGRVGAPPPGRSAPSTPGSPWG